MTDYQYTTVTDEKPVPWKDALGAGFAEHTRRVEERLASFQDSMWQARPGTPADSFQRLAGYCEALVWVLKLSRDSQKSKPGVADE